MLDTSLWQMYQPFIIRLMHATVLSLQLNHTAATNEDLNVLQDIQCDPPEFEMLTDDDSRKEERLTYT